MLRRVSAPLETRLLAARTSHAEQARQGVTTCPMVWDPGRSGDVRSALIYCAAGDKRASGAGGEGWSVAAGVGSPGDPEGPRPASWAPRSSGIVTNA